jgi:hypothetical protein
MIIIAADSGSRRSAAPFCYRCAADEQMVRGSHQLLENCSVISRHCAERRKNDAI